MNMTRVYVSGKMDGLPDHGFAAFYDASKRLREAGYCVISPAEMQGSKDLSWSEYLQRDLSLMFHCDCIALLPNWLYSDGAKLELAVAVKLGLKVIDAITFKPIDVTVDFNFQFKYACEDSIDFGESHYRF